MEWRKYITSCKGCELWFQHSEIIILVYKANSFYIANQISTFVMHFCMELENFYWPYFATMKFYKNIFERENIWNSTCPISGKKWLYQFWIFTQVLGFSVWFLLWVFCSLSTSLQTIQTLKKNCCFFSYVYYWYPYLVIFQEIWTRY